MNIENPEEQAFLYELYTQTAGNIDEQVSMHDVGTALGLEQNDAGTLAENLFIQGFAELKTLSGGIGITNQGMKALDIKPPSRPGEEHLELGSSIVLEDTGKEAVKKMIEEIKKNIIAAQPSYDTMEEIIMDIKTIDVQMLSPQPKTQIIREIFRSIHAGLNDHAPENLVTKLEMLVAS